MTPHVLGVGYSYDEYSVTADSWKKYGIEFDYVDNIRQAVAMLSFKEYPSYSEEQRYACVHFGAAQYLHTYHHPLLIMNQRQVFAYEMIMDAIWHEDFSFYSRNALSSHISNLRKKLKVSETVADHIKSIRGIGYKFEA